MKKKRKPPGYWRDFDNVRKELKDIIENEYRDKDGNLIKRKGEFPTTTQLQKMRKRNLLKLFVCHHGGINAVRKRMGYKPKIAPTGYWADFENIKKVLLEIIANEYHDKDGNLIKRKGEFPTFTVLNKIGRRDLGHGISIYHGGVLSVAEKMGYQARQKPPRYWNFDNVKKEMKNVIDKAYFDKNGILIKAEGRFPTCGQLERIGRSDLLSAVRQHCGLYSLKTEMGYGPIQWKRGYWNKFENMERELRAVIKESGEFPTLGDLKKMGRGYLLGSITRCHGGISALRKKMGYPLKRVPRDYWDDFKNIEKELRPILKKLGRFPTLQQLMRMNYGLCTGFSRWGGIRGVREKMGYERQDLIDGHLKNLDNLERELKPIIEKLGGFPSSTQLRRVNPKLVRAIARYHGGHARVRENLGYKAGHRPKGYWTDFDNVEKALEALIERLGIFPSKRELVKMKMSGLSVAIQKYHGGFPVVREKMGYGERPMPKKIREFMKKVNTVKGAKEILACPDLTLADKTDILININKSLFRSREYTDLVMKSLFKMTSLRPYLRNDEPLHHHYKPQNRLEQVINKYPIYLDEPNIYQLVLRKLENIYFKKMAKKVNEAMNELKEKTYLKGVLGGIYKHVYKDCQEMLNLHIAGTVNKIKNPYKVKERVLKDDGTIEYIHSGNTPDYVQFPALHQKRGILHIVRYKRILIADEMGTGKTAQAVLAKIYLENRLKKRLKTLIICPNSVRELWREKIDEYCKYISRDDVITLAGHRNKRRALNQIKMGTDFVIVNYALLSRIPESGRLNLVDELIKIRFDYVIVDEVHNAKNLNANRALSVSRITRNVEYVVLLSGTPIPNRLKDMGMTMYILDPKRFPNPIGFNKLYSKNPRILRDLLLSGRMLRVRSREVIQLPSLKIKKVTVSPTPDQLSAYTKTFLDHRLNSYDKLARLRRILIDPNIVDPDIETADSGKLTELDRLIQEKVSAGEKVVVYTNFKWRVTDMLARRYRRYGVSVIDGDIPARPRLHDDSDREKIRKEFQTGNKRVLIATIGTMCEGVDLTAARTVIFLDPPFTSTAMDQSTKRVHRLGQSRPVKVYNLIVTAPEIDNISYDQETGDSGTIDEAIYDLVGKKERLIDHVIDGMPLTKDEIRLLEKDSMGSHFLKSISYAITPR